MEIDLELFKKALSLGEKDSTCARERESMMIHTCHPI